MLWLDLAPGLHRGKGLGVFEEEKECVGEDDVRPGPILPMLFPILDLVSILLKNFSLVTDGGTLQKWSLLLSFCDNPIEI